MSILGVNRTEKTKGYTGERSEVTKQCFPLYTLLLALGNPKVHYLSLDVEGPEISILKTIPWDKVILHFYT